MKVSPDVRQPSDWYKSVTSFSMPENELRYCCRLQSATGKKSKPIFRGSCVAPHQLNKKMINLSKSKLQLIPCDLGDCHAPDFRLASVDKISEIASDLMDLATAALAKYLFRMEGKISEQSMASIRHLFLAIRSVQ
jgi:hypothetical protein